MKISLLGLIAILFLTTFSIHLSAQIEKGFLSLGNTIASEILPQEKHIYHIDLQKDQFAFFNLIQKGSDIMITTFDSKGEKMESFDSPNGRYGPEMFPITSSEKGNYKIEVTTTNDETLNGNYELIIQKITKKAILPNDKVDELFAKWDNNNSPGAAVAVIQNGSIIYKKAYGMANLEYDIPVTTSTIFHIASVSKQFTVFSILLLEDEGKLSLDDDIRKFIPEVPDFGKTITLRHLASHTSGLRDQWNLLTMAGWRMDDVITKEHVFKLISKQKELNFDPGEEYLYCNTGFTLLAEVVARVSNQSFADFTKQRIFEPLNMNHSLFYDDHEKIVKNRAYSYHSDSTGLKKSVLSYANVGATSLFTTVEDLSLWAMNFSSMRIGNADIFAKMNTPATLNNGEKFGGALGQFVGEYKGLNQISHGGADAGYRSYLGRFPDQNFAVVVFGNDASFASSVMGNKISDIYLKDQFKIEPPKIMEEDNSKENQVIIDQKTLDSYIGEYEIQPGFILKITAADGQLSAQPQGQANTVLIPISTNEFLVKEVGGKIKFITGANGKVNQLNLEINGDNLEIHRLKEFDKSAVNLVEYIGRFYSEELSTEYIFTIENEKLVAVHSRLSNIELSPAKKDIFSGSTWFFSQIEFIRNNDDNIIGCKVSAGRVKNLWFQKMQ